MHRNPGWGGPSVAYKGLYKHYHTPALKKALNSTKLKKILPCALRGSGFLNSLRKSLSGGENSDELALPG